MPGGEEYEVGGGSSNYILFLDRYPTQGLPNPETGRSNHVDRAAQERLVASQEALEELH
jgi:hypothetical protein